MQLDWEATGLLEKIGAVLSVDVHANKKDLANFKKFIKTKKPAKANCGETCLPNAAAGPTSRS